MDEWSVEKVITHRRDDHGELEFLVQWEGSPERTWEPLHHFFHRYAQPLVEYFVDKNIKEDVMAHLARHPAEAHVAIMEIAETLKAEEEAHGKDGRSSRPTARGKRPRERSVPCTVPQQWPT